MAFCSSCGNKLIDNAKFCQKCGCRVNDIENSERRQQEYVGKVFKCPNCGEVLDSFLTKCPSCGMELRGSKATNSVRELASKLESIELHRENKKTRSTSKQEDDSGLSKTDKQKISLIRSFSIPNTKEDILEFMILATANVDMSSYTDPYAESSRAISNAWSSKCDQAYEKARFSFSKDDPCYIQIEELYKRTKKELKWVKGSESRGFIIAGIIFGLIIATIIIGETVTAPSRNKAEEERLTAIVTEIEEDLEDGKYKLALLNAESMEYKGRDSEAERKWNIKKEYLIYEIINEAEKNGIILEHVEDSQEDESDESESSGGLIEGFIKGFNDARHKNDKDVENSQK